MNSFNHFAFGSVVGWIYRSVVGIEAGAPGFKEVVIHPRIDSRIQHARGEFESVYGKVTSDWSAAPEGPFRLNVTIPPNTRARVYLPARASSMVTEGGTPMECRPEAGECMIEVGSGEYSFVVK
jgi:alpha-L-rhamnosidase